MEKYDELLSIIRKHNHNERVILLKFIIELLMKSDDIDSLDYFVKMFDHDDLLIEVLKHLYENNNLPLTDEDPYGILVRDHLSVSSVNKFINVILSPNNNTERRYVINDNLLIFIKTFMMSELSSGSLEAFLRVIERELIDGNTLEVFRLNRFIRQHLFDEHKEIVTDIYLFLINNYSLPINYIPKPELLAYKLLTYENIKYAYYMYAKKYIENTGYDIYTLMLKFTRKPSSVIGTYFKDMLCFTDRLKDLFKY